MGNSPGAAGEGRALKGFARNCGWGGRAGGPLMETFFKQTEWMVREGNLANVGGGIGIMKCDSIKEGKARCQF